MARIALNLGSVLSQLLKDANANFTELYDVISELQAANEDKGTQRAVVYENAESMVSGLNAGTDGEGNALDLVIGDEIYVLDDDTPDFWIAGVNTTASTGSKPASWESGTNYTFGKYVIRVSKSREIDLADYQKISNLVKTENFLTNKDSEDKYPSVKAVFYQIGQSVGALSTSIKETYATKEELAGAGKVKDVQVKKSNGTTESVLNEETGVATIDLSALSIDVEALEAGIITITEEMWTTYTLGEKTYDAIKILKSDKIVSFELFSNGEEILAQKVTDADGNLYYCIIKEEDKTYTLRTVGGNGVGSEYAIDQVARGARTAYLYQHSVTFKGQDIKIKDDDERLMGLEFTINYIDIRSSTPTDIHTWSANTSWLGDYSFTHRFGASGQLYIYTLGEDESAMEIEARRLINEADLIYNKDLNYELCEIKGFYLKDGTFSSASLENYSFTFALSSYTASHGGYNKLEIVRHTVLPLEVIIPSVG